MIFQPPFYLHGESGKALGVEGYSLAALGIQAAELKLRSLDVDELSFSLRKKPAAVLPDDEQWITLKDDAGVTLFTGICKRSYSYQAGIYRYTCSNVYKGLLETPLVAADGRPYLSYDMGDLADRIRDIILRAGNAGLPIQAPASENMPRLYLIPKMAFRATSYAGALEDLLKWAPDVVSKMDYHTSPPTLRFLSRTDTAATVLDLDSDSHRLTDVTLTPQPEARALGVSFSYARRNGDDLVQYLVQSAGNDAAEARRMVSLYLSGAERTDMLVSEALTTAQKAVAMAQASVDAVGASIDAAAASAQIPLTWAGLLPLESNLQAAVVAEPLFTMATTDFSRTLYTHIACGSGVPDYATHSHTAAGPSLQTLAGSPATGWYPITSGAFSPAELSTAGATKETRYIKGTLHFEIPDTGSAGFFSLPSGSRYTFSGYTQGYTGSCANTSDYYESRGLYQINIPVDAINMAPAAVAAAVKAAAGAASTSFVTRAEFVEAPADLAKNYFQHQDWTPYKGSMDLTPNTPVLPLPGSFLSLRGENVEVGWNDMRAPVSECLLDLRTMAASLNIGPSPRMDFSSLVDRLRIPPEDNYQVG